MSSSGAVANGNAAVGTAHTRAAGTGGAGTGNGAPPPGPAPELPHVTNNIIPLANVLRFYTQEAYKQLARVMENLAHTRTAESDVARKRKFLMVIVALRQDFIKLYTLVKWAQRAKDVSRLIDLLNWFRTQEFYFDQMAGGLGELLHFSGAKLPNSDILTALEVLVKGRPQLASYHHVPKPPVSPEKVLAVVRDMNVALTARMALLDTLPRAFGDYDVRDGRVVLTVAHEFQVSVTVANDLIVDAHEYYRSPFFFLDFAFLFGVDPASAAVTHSGAHAATVLPRGARARLEAAVNQVLLARALDGLYDFLHQYALTYKLHLVSRQLRHLAVHSKWRGNVQYKYTPALLVVNYWTGHHLSRNWRSFVELGVARGSHLHCRWFKNGRYADAAALPDTGVAAAGADLSADFVLSAVTNAHAELLVARIHARYAAAVPGPSVSVLNAHSLLLQLGARSTVFAINPLTGFLYFMNPSPLEAACQGKINAAPPKSKKPFVGETDMVEHVVAHLVQLRLDTFARSLHTKLVAAEWIASDTVHINEHETTKLQNFLAERAAHTAIRFYRYRDWPASWFLVSMLSGLSTTTYWWVARLSSVKGEWKISWVHRLHTADAADADLDYAFFTRLFQACSKAITDHLLAEDLQRRGIGFHRIDDASALLQLGLPRALATGTVVALHNSGALLPVSISSATLFLSVAFLCEGSAKRLQLTLFGFLKNQTDADARALSKLHVQVAPEKGHFTISASADLAEKVPDDAPSHTTALLNQTLDTVSRMNSLIKISDQIRKTNIEMKSGEQNEFVFEIDPFYRPFRLTIDDSGNALTLAADPLENTYVKLVIGFINSEINRSDTALLGSFKYLKLAVPIFESLHSTQTCLKSSKVPLLTNGLPRLQLEQKFQNLNLMHFFFVINSISPNAPKKVQRDHLSFSVSFKKNKHANGGSMLYKFSMKDNFNSQNLKFKKLFELIFRALNVVYKDAMADKKTCIKLNYDFVIQSDLLLPIMNALTGAFVEYLITPSHT